MKAKVVKGKFKAFRLEESRDSDLEKAAALAGLNQSEYIRDRLTKAIEEDLKKKNPLNQ